MATITDSRILQRQQIVLKHLGYYHGKCDGIWGPSTTAAKRAFELSGNYNPGYPNNGMPFNHEGPFPKGIMRDYKNKALITHVDLTDDFIEKCKSELVKHDIKFNPSGEDEPKPVEEKVEVKPVEQKVQVESKAPEVKEDTKEYGSNQQRHFERKQHHQHNQHKQQRNT